MGISQSRTLTDLCYLNAVLVTTLALGMLAGCATQNKSVGLGAGIGSLGGASVGAIADAGKNGENRTRNVVIGAALGGMAGMVAGSYTYSSLERQRGEAFKKGQASAPQPVAGVMPDLKAPQVEARWVEGRTIGNRYIEGHYEYIITEPARWDTRK